MITGYQIPEPFLFNPLKHHLGFIKDFMNIKTEGGPESNIKDIIKELKHLGNSVMDVYSGLLSVIDICKEMKDFLSENNILQSEQFSLWTGTNAESFRITPLSDGSQWTLKFHDNPLRYIHLFPARASQHTFRVRSNTLKSALGYNILIGKDYITGDDLNKVRPLIGLSPIKDSIDNEAIIEMIEILRV